MNTIGLFRQVRVKTFWRSISQASGARKFQIFSLMPFGLMVCLFAFFSSYFVFGSISAEGGRLALAGMFTFTVLVLTGLGSALYTMYLSKDLQLLLTLPIQEQTVFAYKFWEVYATSSGLYLVVGFPVLVAYGLAIGASLLFYPVALVVSTLVLVVPVSACLLLIMPLMCLLPASRAKEIAAALGALVGVVAWVSFYVANPPGDYDTNLPSARLLSDIPLLHLPPGTWAANAATGAANLDFLLLMTGLLPLAGLSCGLYVLCLTVARRAYATGWARTAESSGRVRSSGWASVVFALLPRAVKAVVVKDLVSLPRDPRRLVGVVSAAIIGLMYVVFSSSFFGEGSGWLAAVTPYLIASGVAATAPSWGSLQAVGGEGRAYWVFIASPLGPGRLLLAKWIGTLVIGSVVSFLGVLICSFMPGVFNVPGILVGLVFGPVAAAVAGLYTVGIAAIYPRFDWENPNQTLTSGVV